MYRIQSIRYYISVNNVAELQACTVSDDSVVLGANTTLSDAIVFLKTSASEHTDKFGYLEKIARHIELIANVPVRNVRIAIDLFKKKCIRLIYYESDPIDLYPYIFLFFFF